MIWNFWVLFTRLRILVTRWISDCYGHTCTWQINMYSHLLLVPRHSWNEFLINIFNLVHFIQSNILYWIHLTECYKSHKMNIVYILIIIFALLGAEYGDNFRVQGDHKKAMWGTLSNWTFYMEALIVRCREIADGHLKWNQLGLRPMSWYIILLQGLCTSTYK